MPPLARLRCPRPVRLALYLAHWLPLWLSLCACGPGAVALHSLSETPEDFYDLPFPSDLRLRPDGTLDLSRYPRLPGQLTRYVQDMDGQIPGAGPSAGILFRLSAPLDPGTLPGSAAQSQEPGASAFVVDVTETSPTYGQRAPVLASFHEEGGRFIGPNWLALRPVPGFPLRPRTTYAAVLTTSLRAADGGPVRRHPDLDLLLHGDPPQPQSMSPREAAAWARYAPLRAYLAGNFPVGAVAAATVFTTSDPTSLMHRLREATYRAPAPRAADLRYIRDHDGICHIYHGTFLSPNFQQGAPPYLDGGGQIAPGPDGVPVPTRTESLRFALSVPNAPMPPSGWPVALYAHGTGGDFQTFIREGVDLRAAHIEMDGGVLARMAVISIDQVLHGPRDPTQSPVDLTFFNLKNLAAARDNPRQGAADDFQLLRLVKGFGVDAAPVTGRPIRFDERHLYFIGHSQGGLTGPLFLGAEPEVRAAVLSGAGAVLVLSLIGKTEPVDVASLVENLIGEPVGPDHPFLNLLQAYFEPADPNNYGPLLFREPPPGAAPKSIFQSLGVVDRYTPVPNIKAFALSMGVQPVTPVLSEIEHLALRGLRWTAPPVQGNTAEGRATAVLRQYQQREDSDGHYVLFERWPARQDWSRFLGTDIATGRAQLPF